MSEAPHSLPLCEACGRRRMPREVIVTKPELSVIIKTCCGCDWPMPGEHVIPAGEKPDLVVNGTQVEGDVSFHPKDRVQPETAHERVPVLGRQAAVLEMLAKATPDQVAQIHAIINNGNGNGAAPEGEGHGD